MINQDCRALRARGASRLNPVRCRGLGDNGNPNAVEVGCDEVGI
jgi:hypothetical protein